MNLGECFLELAKNEEDSGNLYKEFATTCSGKLKSICIKFSKEEHNAGILKLSKNIKSKDKQLNEDLNDFFKEQTNYIKIKHQNINFVTEKDFFIFVLQMEKNSIKIYTKLLSMFKIDSDEFKIFEKLLNEEKRHMIYILSQIHKLN
ncbi:ferritin family protein [Clostridium vincentii]|uniref:Uncharacterized protein n=1 Tax=Clostridium vincentii TaxID=52704 RepID=A0A2T0BCT2_9CLOT|nr:ferritin family protein [Clostridium vincentii]PRR81691.1 hypothetical protein CLVI_23000 [Clostridium vincentii]